MFYKIIASYMRKQFGDGDRVRDEGLTIPEDVQVFDNIQYGPHGTDNLLSVSRPQRAEGKLPCIVSFHGGGFFYGNKEVYQFYCADLARRGFVVINFNYRLTPEHRFPAPLHDSNRVMEWLVRHSEQYGADLENLFFVGDSAGAQLASHYTTIITSTQMAKMFDFTVPKEIQPKAVALNCGMYDILNLNDKMLSMTIRAYGRKEYRKRSERMNVVEYMNSDFPPTYVVTATNDFLRKYAKPQAELMEQRGIECEYHLYGEEDDETAVHVFHVNVRSELGRQCNDDECNFFKNKI